MFSIIIKKTVGYWASAGVIADSDSDIYEYGLELILFSVLNIAVIIATAIFTRKLPESIALLVSVIPLQSFGGGYHAKTHLRCFFIMYIGWWVIMWLIPYTTPLIMMFLAGISLIVIFVLAPVSHENVKLSDKQRLKMKKLVRGAAVSTVSMSVVTSGLIVSYKNISGALIIGIGAVALSMLAARFKEMIVNSQ